MSLSEVVNKYNIKIGDMIKGPNYIHKVIYQNNNGLLLERVESDPSCCPTTLFFKFNDPSAQKGWDIPQKDKIQE